ncbi:MAG: excinuclease ABC subunit UvrA [Bacilli bacterium]|jgi:excinuclease ABC subunit A
MDKIIIKGAKEHNLKNIDIEIPKYKLVVITGVSGSGKSSLAFDTIYKEGQRRYVESLSAYARQFLGGTEKPKVDSIEGLSPAISIEQKTTNKNPRSTVGTVTEVYDYLRLLYARIGVSYCPRHNIPITNQSVQEMVDKVMELKNDTKVIIMSPIIHGEKGMHKDTIDNLRKSGFIRIRINNEIKDLGEEIVFDKNKINNIDVIIDRLVIEDDIRSRLHESIETATKLSDGRVIIDVLGDKEIHLNEKLGCPYCDFSLVELEPRSFSFNSPYGACPDCKGLGYKLKIDEDLIIPNKEKRLNKGAILPFNNMDDSNIYLKKLEVVCDYYKIDMKKKINDLKRRELDIILYGSSDIIPFNFKTRSGKTYTSKEQYEGIINNLERRYMETTSEFIRDWLSQYMIEQTCPTCKGARLKEEYLSVLINQKNIYELSNLSIRDILIFFQNLKLSKEKQMIAELLIKEIKDRLTFLVNVGLDYLTLNRGASTLSGGEAQRIRLATQIGSRLSGVLYVLDEPSIGLHQRDNQRLINSLLEMRDLGNTLIVVEHDHNTMLQADYLIDIGPKAGVHGGYVVAEGTPKEVLNNKESLTGLYLKGEMKIEIPKERRKGNKRYLELKGCKANNLKNIDISFPLGKFICVTGVSGSGKSTLVEEILYKALVNNLYKSKEKPGAYKEILGLRNIDKVINISQAPIGRTPRSNPATYTSVFDDIRDVFAQTKEAKIRGYAKGRFSFNVKGGRCETCSGDGVKRIEMHFLPDVYVPCEICKGTRYNRETLAIKFKGKNIAEVLDMTVDEAYDFFSSFAKIKNKLKILLDVGLGFIKLGQSAPTLSGGEASRIKLAKELQKKATGKSLFILDEPTTGLHTDDIKKLLIILNRIVDNGDTVIIIEHNLDIIKVADYIIDLGPEGGDLGGEIIAVGTPEEIMNNSRSYTGKYLKEVSYTNR